MPSNRRVFMRLAGAATAVTATAWASTPAGAQTSGQFKAIKALAFDAYGTLFDVFSVKRLATSPAETGSAAVEKTIGIVVVAARSHVTDGCGHRLTDMLAVNLSTLPQPSQGDQSVDLDRAQGRGVKRNASALTGLVTSLTLALT